MTKKQIAGLVAAALVFTFVCFMSVLSTNMAEQARKKSTVQQIVQSQLAAFDLPSEDFIGVVNVVGTIMDADSAWSLETYNHKSTLDLIEALAQSRYNKGILLRINSPGGTVYASDELYEHLKKYKEETGRPVWAYMEDMAASGGYYVAAASDTIYANRNTLTGSIGVIMQMTNVKELYEKLGLKQIAITSDRNKDIGSPYKDMTPEQMEIFQALIDEMYDQFLSVILENRDFAPEELRELADGRIYTARQALALGLIDEIAYYDDVVEALEKEYRAKIHVPKLRRQRLFSLFDFLSNLRPLSDVEIICETIHDERNGVPMYYVQPGY